MMKKRLENATMEITTTERSKKSAVDSLNSGMEDLLE